MKYWLYTEGNILGPYDPAEMLCLPAFSQDSLICEETATGDNAEDWKSAAQVGEIASMMGAGRAVTASVAAGSYKFETALNYCAPEFEDKESKPVSTYSELLDTIDNILGTRKEDPDPTLPQPIDYELAEKFDIRLSRIQEELEAARWEKNLLLEKMRMKESEEKKNRERIIELEARLKGALRGTEINFGQAQASQPADNAAGPEAAKNIEEIKREELALETYLARESADKAPAEAPMQTGKASAEIEVKNLKNITPSEPIVSRRPGDTGPEETAPEPGVASRKLRSLGETEPPAYVYGVKNEGPAPSARPWAATVPAGNNSVAQQQGEVEVIADKSAVNVEAVSPGVNADPPAAATGSIQAAPLEPVLPQPAAPVNIQAAPLEPVLPQPAAPVNIQVAPLEPVFPKPVATAHTQAAPPPAAQPAMQPIAFNPVSSPQRVYSQPHIYTPPVAAAPPRQAATFSPSDPVASEDKPADFGNFSDHSGRNRNKEQVSAPAPGAVTVPLPLPENKGQSAAAVPGKPVKKGGRAAFFVIILIFGFIAAGGLGYFFLGDGVSFSEFSMMNFVGVKKTARPAAQPAFPAMAAEAQRELPPQQPALTDLAAEAGQAGPAASTAEERPSKNIRRALEIVKTYKLAGGRGSIESWFVNSFLSGGSGGANEEWTATPLHGDILVVQYRLLRPRQEPMIYQFEVDTVKGDIVRGINNNAIELLDAAREKTVSAAPVKKPLRQPRVRTQVKPRALAILPLPAAPAAGGRAEADPTGFERPENDEKVKYLKAQESDEELF